MQNHLGNQFAIVCDQFAGASQLRFVIQFPIKNRKFLEESLATLEELGEFEFEMKDSGDWILGTPQDNIQPHRKGVALIGDLFVVGDFSMVRTTWDRRQQN